MYVNPLQTFCYRSMHVITNKNIRRQVKVSQLLYNPRSNNSYCKVDTVFIAFFQPNVSVACNEVPCFLASVSGLCTLCSMESMEPDSLMRSKLGFFIFYLIDFHLYFLQSFSLFILAVVCSLVLISAVVCSDSSVSDSFVTYIFIFNYTYYCTHTVKSIQLICHKNYQKFMKLMHTLSSSPKQPMFNIIFYSDFTSV